MSPRILTLDIETAPHVADVWGMFQQNVGLNQLHSVTRVICFAAKWHDEKRPMFFSEYHDTFEEMVSQAYHLIDEADVLVGWNSQRFDNPHLRREFLLQGLQPPSPVIHLDLMKVARKEFRFASNKLDHVTRQLGLEGKITHQGHTLWRECLDPDVDDLTRAKAWQQMKKYNIGDVIQTEKVLDILRPWATSGLHMGLWGDGQEVCSRCGSTDLTRRGYAYTSLSKYQRYRCTNCGAWSRGAKTVARQEIRGIQ